MAPIFKNRQYNFLGPLGFNGAPLGVLPVGAQARPNEVTYSEDWMRPDFVPPATAPPAEPATAPIAQAPLRRRGAGSVERSRGGSARHDGAPRSRVMTGALRRRAAMGLAALALTAVGVSGCGWRGLNSLPLPGTEGGGPGSYLIQAQVPDVNNIEPNSRVRVGRCQCRQRHKRRAPGLARIGDYAHQR